MKPQKGIFLPITGIVVFVILLVGIWYYSTLQPNPEDLLLSQSPIPDISNKVVATPMSTIIPATPKTKADDINWKMFIHPTGNYSIKYPSKLTLNENKTSSVDGVKVDSKNTIELVPIGLNIKFKTVDQNLNNYLKANKWCEEIVPEKGKQFLLDGIQGLIFENTNCGPRGITEIDVINKGTLYTIGIINYDEDAHQIVSTFQFTN